MKKYILIVFLCLPLMVSAGKKKIVKQISPSEVMLQEHFAKGDIQLLVDDYVQHPELRERIARYMLCEQDFSQKNYSELLDLYSIVKSKLQQDSTLSVGLRAIVADREALILNQLAEMNMEQQANYYIKCNPAEHQFLKPIFQSIYSDRIEQYRFPDIKQIAMYWGRTDIGAHPREVFAHQKATYLTKLNENIQEYLKLEKQLVSDYKKRSQAEAQWITDSLYSIMQKKLLSDKAREQYRNGSLDPTLYSQIMSNEIGDIVYQNMIDIMECLKQGRTTFHDELFGSLGESVQVSMPYLAACPHFDFPMKAWNAYVEEPPLSPEEDQLIEAVLNTFTPLGWINMLGDLAESVTPESQRKKPKQPQNKQKIFLNQLYKSMQNIPTDYVNDMFSWIENRIELSQQEFKEKLHEKFYENF